MRSLITKQAERFLRERKNYKRWLAVFTCLAAMVVLGTVMVLRYTGTAMTGDPQCGLEEHVHTDECYQEVLICGQEADAGHEHTDTCYEKQLICGTEEHTHADACYEKEDAVAEEEAAAEDGTEPGMAEEPDETADGQKDPAEQDTVDATGYTMTVQGEDYTVTVTYGDDAGIPDNAELLVEEITEDSPEYQEYYQQMLDAMAQKAADEGTEEGTEVSFARIFDISFMVDGEKIEPAAPVDVRISYPELIEVGEDEEVSAVHFAEDGTEVLDAEVTEGEEGSDFVFTQESFSVTSTVISRAPSQGALKETGSGWSVIVKNGKAGFGRKTRLVVTEIKDNGASENNSYRKYLNNSQGAIKEHTNNRDKDVNSSFARVFEISIEDENKNRLSYNDVEVEVVYSTPVGTENAAVAAMVLNSDDSGKVLSMMSMKAGDTVTTFSGRQSFSADAPNVMSTMVTNIEVQSGEVTPGNFTNLDKDGTIGGVKGNGKNQWQIVEEEYAGNESKNKTMVSDDGNVRVQKNVIPTDVENQFYVYLSIDTRMVIEEFFDIKALSAITHADNVGGIMEPTNNSQKVAVQVGGEPIGKKGTYTIYDPDGNPLDGLENIMISWGKDESGEGANANKVSLVYDINGTKYFLYELNSGDKNKPIKLSDLVWDALKNQVKSSVALEQVKDQMGDYIIYNGVEKVDGIVEPEEAQTVAGGTIIWKPEVKESGVEKWETTEEVKGKNVKVVWSKNVAELLYEVKLDVKKDKFQSCADKLENETGDPSYPVNESAILTYKPLNADGTTDDPVDLVFKKPYVRGLLYDIPLIKQDSENVKELLSGAEFVLRDRDGNQIGEKVTTGTDGKARFEGLPWGTYEIWETKAPAGYKLPEKAVATVTVCYTEERSKLEPGNDGTLDLSQITNLKPGENGHMVYYSTETKEGDPIAPPIEGVVIKNDKIPPIILEKVWVGDEDAKNLRPGNVTFVVSGTEKDTGASKEKEVTFGSGEDGQWRYEYAVPFEADENGYVVTEKELENYTASPTDGPVKDEESGYNVYTITNTLIERKILILKKSEEGSFLAGAHFALYSTEEEGAKPMTGMEDLVSDTKEGKDGVIFFDNLPAGTYWLKETQAPDGHNKLKEPIKITVCGDENKIIIENPNQTNPGTETVIEPVDNVYTIIVLNSTGYELPSTGGPGTILYTFGGLAILAIGLVYGLGMKRKQERGYK